MTTGRSIYLRLQGAAPERRRPADEIFTIDGLERFLGRLADSPFSEDFWLKGGVLLSAHALHHPTRDVDTQALDFQLDVDDGLVFDHASMQIERIRDEDE